MPVPVARRGASIPGPASTTLKPATTTAAADPASRRDCQRPAHRDPADRAQIIPFRCTIEQQPLTTTLAQSGGYLRAGRRPAAVAKRDRSADPPSSLPISRLCTALPTCSARGRVSIAMARTLALVSDGL